MFLLPVINNLRVMQRRSTFYFQLSDLSSGKKSIMKVCLAGGDGRREWCDVVRRQHISAWAVSLRYSLSITSNITYKYSAIAAARPTKLVWRKEGVWKSLSVFAPRLRCVPRQVDITDIISYTYWHRDWLNWTIDSICLSVSILDTFHLRTSRQKCLSIVFVIPLNVKNDRMIFLYLFVSLNEN